ncbi:MAG: hypothetical protein HZA90_26560 [Verrucomicrobia bacterium]|nr:hypothetical protein [Verrucomicrobiota bacterium]
MNTAFRESFDADLSAIADAALLGRVKEIILQVEAAQTFQQIPNFKRLETSGACSRKAAKTQSSGNSREQLSLASRVFARGELRLRDLGDYRIGFVFERGTVTFVR